VALCRPCGLVRLRDEDELSEGPRVMAKDRRGCKLLLCEAHRVTMLDMDCTIFAADLYSDFFVHFHDMMYDCWFEIVSFMVCF
jgi:hypothetical protein